jgi:hypothetical protein
LEKSEGHAGVACRLFGFPRQGGVFPVCAVSPVRPGSRHEMRPAGGNPQDGKEKPRLTFFVKREHGQKARRAEKRGASQKKERRGTARTAPRNAVKRCETPRNAAAERSPDNQKPSPSAR